MCCRCVDVVVVDVDVVDVVVGVVVGCCDLSFGVVLVCVCCLLFVGVAVVVVVASCVFAYVDSCVLFLFSCLLFPVPC